MFVLKNMSQNLLQTLRISYEDIKRKHSSTQLAYFDKSEKLICSKSLNLFFLRIVYPKEMPRRQTVYNSNYYATLISVPTSDGKEAPVAFFICSHSTQHSQQNVRNPDKRHRCQYTYRGEEGADGRNKALFMPITAVLYKEKGKCCPPGEIFHRTKWITYRKD